MATKKSKSRKSRRKVLFILSLIAVILCLPASLLLIFTRLQQKPEEISPMENIIEETLSTERKTEVISETEPETQPETLPPGTVTGISLSFYHAFLHVDDVSVMPVVRMSPDDAIDISEIWESSDETVATVDKSGMITPVGAGECQIRVTSASNPDIFADVNVKIYSDDEDLPDPDTISCSGSPRDDIQVIGGITYVQGIMLVNKTYPLPASYNPHGMTSETEEAFSQLCQAASEEANLSLFSHSDFRSYQTQVYLYSDYSSQYGSEAADRFSARAGYSEHQTGMVIDVNWPGDAFNDTPEAIWLEQNCARFGFIIRFPREKEAYTGYKYESWHIRYVGKELAEKIMQSGLCLEEYLNVMSEYP